MKTAQIASLEVTQREPGCATVDTVANRADIRLFDTATEALQEQVGKLRDRAQQLGTRS